MRDRADRAVAAGCLRLFNGRPVRFGRGAGQRWVGVVQVFIEAADPAERVLVGQRAVAGVVPPVDPDPLGAEPGELGVDVFAALAVGVVAAVAQAEHGVPDPGQIGLQCLQSLEERLGAGRELAVTVRGADDDVEFVSRHGGDRIIGHVLHDSLTLTLHVG